MKEISYQFQNSDAGRMVAECWDNVTEFNRDTKFANLIWEEWSKTVSKSGLSSSSEMTDMKDLWLPMLTVCQRRHLLSDSHRDWITVDLFVN